MYSIFLSVISIIFVIYIHELSKAYASYKLGDVSIKNTGNLTLNPLKYIDPLGFLVFLFTGYGWSNPVETSSLYYKNRKHGTLITYGLPILINFILGIVFIIIFSFTNKLIFNYLGTYCIHMAVFNLIPVYPLCGQKILLTILSSDKAFFYSKIEKFIQIIVVIFLLSGHLVTILNFLVKIIINLILKIV